MHVSWIAEAFAYAKHEEQGKKYLVISFPLLEFWHYPHTLLLPQESNAYKSNIITQCHEGVTT